LPSNGALNLNLVALLEIETSLFATFILKFKMKLKIEKYERNPE